MSRYTAVAPAMDSEETRVKRSYRTLATRIEKVYMAVAAVEALVVVAIAFSAFGIVQANVEVTNTKSRTVPVYLSVFILAQIFSLLYVFDALRARNIIQLVLHLFFNVCILTYSVLQIPQTKNALSGTPDNLCGSYSRCFGPGSLYRTLQKLYIVNPIILGLCTIAFGTLIRLLFVEFGWAVFHIVGASPQLKRMHREYQTLISLLKMVLFFAIAFCMAYLILVTKLSTNRAEFIVTIIALPLVPLCVLACGWALREENKPVMGGCLFFMVAGLVYFIYKLASMWLPQTKDLYINTKITMAIFSIFAIIILLATFVYGGLCMSNFGKGLIQAHKNPENKTSLWAFSSNVRHQEKVKADLQASQPQPTDRLVID